jgi:hypothetical protein
MVLVAAMIPSPGESADQMWVHTRFDDAERPETDDSGDLAIFYYDVPRTLAEEALSKGRPQSETTSAEPFPLAAWPNVPTAVIVYPLTTLANRAGQSQLCPPDSADDHDRP